MSHEQVPTVVILRLETGKSTIPGVWCRRRVVPHSCENKAISAPSWAWAELGNIVSENVNLVAKIKENNKNFKALTDTTKILLCKISEAERKDAKSRIENVGLQSKMKAVKNKYVEDFNDLKVHAREGIK